MELNRQGRFYSRLLQSGSRLLQKEKWNSPLHWNKRPESFKLWDELMDKYCRSSAGVGGWRGSTGNVIGPSVFANCCLWKLGSCIPTGTGYKSAISFNDYISKGYLIGVEKDISCCRRFVFQSNRERTYSCKFSKVNILTKWRSRPIVKKRPI